MRFERKLKQEIPQHCKCSGAGTPYSGWAGDGGDSYRSGALQVSYLNFTAGMKIFTGLRGNEQFNAENLLDGGRCGASCEENGVVYPYGQVVEYGPKYRLGAVYVGYDGYQVGLNSQRISHGIQGIGVHGTVKPQRAFSVFDKTIYGYFQYQSYNPFTLW